MYLKVLQVCHAVVAVVVAKYIYRRRILLWSVSKVDVQDAKTSCCSFIVVIHTSALLLSVLADTLDSTFYPIERDHRLKNR